MRIRGINWRGIGRTLLLVLASKVLLCTIAGFPWESETWGHTGFVVVLSMILESIVYGKWSPKENHWLIWEEKH